MDLTESIQPKSEQLDSVDLLAGARTFRVERLSAGNAEQPINVHLEGFPRPWRPSKNMRRVLVKAWGADGAQYVGRYVRLFCDPTVVFGGAEVGGVRIEALSHIDGPVKVPVLVKRGKTEVLTIPRLEVNTDPTPAQIAAVTDVAELRDLYRAAKSDDIRALITARKDEIEGGA